MELRRSTICLALFVVAAFSQCSEAHTVQRRDAEDSDYDDPQLADEANEDDTQNDTDYAGDNEPKKVEVPAVILTKPETYELTLGKDVRLECKVSPEDGTVVQWYKDNVTYFIGTMKTNADANRFSIVQDSKDLLIKDLKLSDSGTYKCETLHDNPVSISHTVLVLESPKILRFSATNGGSVVEGADLLLTCDVAGLPPPQIVWSKDGENGNERLQEKDGEFSGNSVYIKNVKKEQSGKYLCYAFNSVGHNQAEIKVTIAGKPRVHVRKTIENSAINVEAVLQCSAHEEAVPHMRWYKDGKLIEDSSTQFSVSTNGSHSNLTVTPRTAEDFGTFTCEAENAHGKHNRSIQLVQSPVIEGLDVDGPKLSWTVHSHQPLEEIEVQLKPANGDGDWTRLSVPVPETKTHRYEISYELTDKQLEPGRYEAVVKVKNNNSWSTSNDAATVDIEAQPQLIQHASVYRGNNAQSIRPSTAVVSTILMYLLVRML